MNYKITMINKYYEDQIRQLADKMEKSLEKRISFLQNLLLVSTSIVGIVISLHNTNSECQYIRLAFYLSTVLLSLGALSLAVVLYDLSNIQETLCQAVHDEILNAIQKCRNCNPVSCEFPSRTLFLEKASYFFLILGLILQITYTGLLEFKPLRSDKEIERKEIIIKQDRNIIDNQAPNR